LRLKIDPSSDTQKQLESWGQVEMKGKWVGDVFYYQGGNGKYGTQLLVTPIQIKFDEQVAVKDPKDGKKVIGHLSYIIDLRFKTVSLDYSS
jgi:hypothetical protein